MQSCCISIPYGDFQQVQGIENGQEIAWIRVLIVATVETYRFQRIARNLPDFVKRLSPVPLEELINYPGLISFTFEEGLAYVIMAMWTVSRASDCVAGELSRGTLEMKYFFTAAIPGAAGSVAHSSEAVRHRIRQLVDAEGHDVLSDDALVQRLRAEGIDIARRTVAKYRESLRIPSSIERRRERLAPVR